MTLFERDNRGTWHPVTDAISGGDLRGRIFSRVAGSGGNFDPQPFPTMAVDVNVVSLALRCFQNGNLWAFATLQTGDDVVNQNSAVFHRSSTAASWQLSSLPTTIGNAGRGTQGVIIDSEGSSRSTSSRRPRRPSSSEVQPAPISTIARFHFR